MKWLLDTNVISELRRLHRCHPQVRRWQEDRDPCDCHVSVISLMELKLGVELARARDLAAGKVLLKWYEDVEDSKSQRQKV